MLKILASKRIKEYMKITAMGSEYFNTINAISRARVYRRQKQLRDVIGGWAFKQTSCSFLRTSGFREAVLQVVLFFFRSYRGFVLSLATPHLYCYVIYLSHPGAKECAPFGALAAPEGCPYFSLSLISHHEKPGRVYRVTYNFALSCLTNVPAYLKLWHPAKVCVCERDRDREASARREAAYRYSLQWERLIEIAAGIARAAAEKTNPLGIERFPCCSLVIYLEVFEVNRIC